MTDGGGHTVVAHDVVTVADPLRASLTLSPAHPETGDTVLLDASGSGGGVGPLAYAFDLDGDGVPDGAPSATATTGTVVTHAGGYRFGVSVGDTRGQSAGTVASTDMTQRLAPDFSAPAVITDDQPATLDASPTSGGAAPLHYAWDLEGDGSYETDGGSSPTLSARFPHTGAVDVGLQVADALGHVRAVRKPLTVQSGCVHAVTFGTTRITTATNDICLRRGSGAADSPYTATGDVALNGMPIHVVGGTLTVTPPSGAALAKIVASDVQVTVNGAKIVDGAISWSLPATAAGEEHSIIGVGLGPNGVTLLGLHADGRIGFALGADAGGTPYVRVSANLVIPGFTLSSAASSPGVTGKVTFRIDAAGVHFDGAKLRIDHAKLRGLDVNDICLSYVAAGQTGDQCAQFQDHGNAPFLSCATDVDTDRWNGTMDITLPTQNGAGFAFSGELENGSLANLAAKAELGHAVPLAEGVFLKSIAAGVCLKPPPLTIRGQAVVSALPQGPSDDAVEVDGSFTYVDAANGNPWSITLAGGLTLENHHVADGSAGVDGDGGLSLGFEKRMQFPSDDVDVASIDGSVHGWLKGSAFDIEGHVQACLVDVFCTGGDALLSSSGVAACVDLFTVYYPIVDVGWLYADVSYGSYTVRGGFGYRWGGGVDVMGGSCDIGPWRPVAGGASVARAAAGGVRHLRVKRGDLVENLKLQGVGAPPEVTVTGPGGLRIDARAIDGATQKTPRFLVVRDPVSATTVIQLVKPAAGTYTIAPVAGSTIRGVETAPLQLPPAVGARVRHSHGTYHVDFASTPQKGTKLTFVERHGTLAQSLGSGHSERCPRKVDRRTSRKVVVRCGTLAFSPVDRPGGKREIDVQITRAGIPVSTHKVATYVAPKPARPARVKQLRITRTATKTTAAWASSAGAARYEATATSPEGYRTLYRQLPRCRVITLPKTPKASSVEVRVIAISKTGKRRPVAKLRLPANKDRAGAKLAKPRHASGKGKKKSKGRANKRTSCS